MRALILAAGRGERLRPLTDAVPKPLLEIHGVPLIDRHLHKLCAVGIVDIVINVSYRAQQIMDHVGDGTRFGVRVRYSHEPLALESGGGLATAAPLLGDGPIAIVSADLFSNIHYAALTTYGATLQPHRAHMWFVPPRPDAPGREFSVDANGTVIEKDESAVTYAGVILLHSTLLIPMPRGQKYPLLPHLTQWVSARWVSGEIHHGIWDNVTSVQDIVRLNSTQFNDPSL